MPRWLPVEETEEIVRHVIVVTEIAIALAIVTVVFEFLIPEWEGAAELVDGIVFIGLLVILGVKLLRRFARENGLSTFAAA
jgi:hypothetical protein